ncbi:MAG: ATP-dependent zinc metalloprotease FtsH [Nitrosomonas sp.]|jgi:cell division protease FtsH|uniref:ATP-dependent zinc metalloprotease FtsH n=1 Tax=Nitrosomonas sp. TaxID=42353 RepID=UPI000A7972A0|nr:ATP-dependent zinc metalloprotease FtsH [Nitrosomonas sp.]MDO9469444.1 ATP-dependent zinc metalloprotease FtsH [Nitrosomonas sp.]MDP1786571.1 ATP-dependent zinc metalloprotease FtsH [Nitrosomonas sp.]MDP1934526.1 ATP-dependent zinc metalloprotease FtsH [Nitrosomonas sp.]MDP2223404.1 ATP-dependent zinc metalloprotease FtsH [Nitrosomonas sp.]MDP3282150.1 ATP-dependent zinc metalloprotease FtsH [Nitrosomonas sp.]
MDKKSQINFWFVIVALFGLLLIQNLYSQYTQVEPIPYSRFMHFLEEGRVAEIAITEHQIFGTLKEKNADGIKDFVTTRVEPDLAEVLDKHNVVYSGVVQSTWVRDLLSWIVPTAIFVGIWLFVIRRMGSSMGSGLMSIGKSHAKVFVEKETKVTFDDVAGVDEAKEELVEIINFLKNPVDYGRLGGRAPKGILLVGPPGTGKTLLARAVAGEAGVPFFSISGSEFVEMFVGVGAARVRDLFEQARQMAPAIIFIDELDALGRARGAYGLGGGHDEKEQTLNQLLAELDGFDSSSGIVLLAATNRPEILDPALLRAGRFDRQVLVDRPDKIGREQILAVHAKKVKLNMDVKIEQIAALTPGFTGADLANLINEATLLATRRAAASVTMDDFNNAIERIVAGLEKRNRLLNPEERRVVAFHELGHTMVALALPGTDEIHKVSIIPRGVGALGYTIQRPTEDRFLMTRVELLNKMAVLLGGRAAEQVVFQEVSTGAADDLVRATDIARAMVLRYGMSEALGNVAYEREQSAFLQPNIPMPQNRSYSEETANKIDIAVRVLVDQALERAINILQANRPLLDQTAEALLKTETLNQPEIIKLKQAIISQAMP